MLEVAGLGEAAETCDLRQVFGFFFRMHGECFNPHDFLEWNGDDKRPHLVVFVNGRAFKDQMGLAVYVGDSLDLVAEPVAKVDQHALLKLVLELDRPLILVKTRGIDV